MFTRTASRVNQCHPIGKMNFVRVLTPFFKGTLNIRRHRKVISTGKVCRSGCSHFDSFDAMNLILKTNARETIGLVSIVVRTFIKKNVRQNSCKSWQCLCWIKLFGAITLLLRRCNHCWAMKRCMSLVVRLGKAVFEINVCWSRTKLKMNPVHV